MVCCEPIKRAGKFNSEAMGAALKRVCIFSGIFFLMMESNKSGATIQLSKYVKIGFYLVGLVCVCVCLMSSLYNLSLFLSFSFFDQCVSIPLKRWFKYGPKFD